MNEAGPFPWRHMAARSWPPVLVMAYWLICILLVSKRFWSGAATRRMLVRSIVMWVLTAAYEGLSAFGVGVVPSPSVVGVAGMAGLLMLRDWLCACIVGVYWIPGGIVVLAAPVGLIVYGQQGLADIALSAQKFWSGNRYVRTGLVVLLTLLLIFDVACFVMLVRDPAHRRIPLLEQNTNVRGCLGGPDVGRPEGSERERQELLEQVRCLSSGPDLADRSARGGRLGVLRLL